jgi:fructose-bisphosphate aldolase, class I
MSTHELEAVAQALVAPGKGILAADESTRTITKRLDSIRVESTEATRRAYREMLFATSGMEKYISGVILYDETIRQSTGDGTPFPQVLANKGVIPGIKVDVGTADLAGFPGEKVTEGLDGLRDRMAEYVKLGARFVKWRAVITIGEGIPTQGCIQANADALARYAALAQEAGLVPIVEPEVLMDGGHDLTRCEQATEATLRTVFATLAGQRVRLEWMLLKPNMVIPGKGSPVQASASEIAEATIRIFKHTVPAAVPGIVFLSGGQSAVQATENLNAINALGPQPWQLSFSYGRALQDPALKAWGGKALNVPVAQKILLHRAMCNGTARNGQWSPKMEKEPEKVA